jgi:hypothetical protein
MGGRLVVAGRLPPVATADQVDAVAWILTMQTQDA